MGSLQWLIDAMHWVGLAKNLKRVPWFKIRRVMLETQDQHADGIVR